MSLFSRPARSALLVASLLVMGAAISGCSFTPVYGDAVEARSVYAMQYAEPHSRLEQIVYQDLALRFATGPDAPLLTVNVSQAGRAVTRSQNVSPFENSEMVVTADVTLVSGDTVLLDATRFASAYYTTNGQALADRAAAQEAAERAARSLAETIRLTVIAALSQ